MKRLSICYLKRFILLLAVCATLSSCKIAYYPTSHNSPMLSNKGEIQLGGILGAGNFELHSAYAITDNIGVMLNGSYYNENEEIELNGELKEITKTHNLVEVGAGYFTMLGDMGKFEVFGGGGIGNVPADFRDATYTYDGTQSSSITKFFIQPAIGLGSELVDFSGVIRLSSININDESCMFIEPGLVMKLGYKSVRFVGNIGLSASTKDMGTLSWDHNPLIIGLGIQLNFGRVYQQK